MYRQSAAVGVVMLLLWPLNCLAQLVDQGPVRAGDRWTYDVKDEVTGDLKGTFSSVVVEVTNKEINTRTFVRGRDRPQTIIYDLIWSRIDDGVWFNRATTGDFEGRRLWDPTRIRIKSESNNFRKLSSSME